MDDLRRGEAGNDTDFNTEASIHTRKQALLDLLDTDKGASEGLHQRIGFKLGIQNAVALIKEPDEVKRSLTRADEVLSLYDEALYNLADIELEEDIPAPAKIDQELIESILSMADAVLEVRRSRSTGR